MSAGGQKINFNDGVFMPMDMFHLILKCLTVFDHAHLAGSSIQMMRLVDGYEQSVLANFRSLEAPETHDVIIASKYIKNLTACIKCRPGVFHLKIKEIQAVYWVTYHIGYHLLKSYDCSAQHEDSMYPIWIDTPYQVPATTLENEEYEDVKSPTGEGLDEPTIQSSLSQYLDLACDILRNAQQAGVHAVYWVNDKIGYKLLNSGDALYQVAAPTMSQDKYDEDVKSPTGEVLSEPNLQSSLSHSFDLASAILRRAHQAIFHDHPPLITPELAEYHPNLHSDILNVMFHALTFIHDKPEFAQLWDQVKAERYLLQMYGPYWSDPQ
jgi:hypothetical protein